MSDVKREGLVYGLSEDEYHAPKDELSSTGAKLILESPAKFKHQVLDGNRVHRAAYDLGTAVHTKVLGVGDALATYPPEHLTKSGNVSTKAETVAWAAEQRERGLVIVSPDQALIVDAMAEAVLAHPTAKKLFEREGHPEVSIFDEYLGVKRRGRFDYLPDEGGIAVDLKTAINADPRAFDKSVAKFGYHVQRGHYLDILNRATGRELDMLFVVVEKTAPYLVSVNRLSTDFAEMGETEALNGLDIYRECMASGVWPGYGDEIHDIVPPMFSVYEFQDRYENGEITL